MQNAWHTYNQIVPYQAVDLSLTPSIEFARDMFMMSFYLRGMSFIDMAFLKKTNLKNGNVTYRQHKTGSQLVIKWTDEIQMIIDKYPENASDYLMPIIRNPGTNEKFTYHNVGYKINRNLKKTCGKGRHRYPPYIICGAP